jgi:hypothetical protein
MDDIDKREAELLARLEAEREQRLAEKVAAGEVVSVPLFIVAGSANAARARVEGAKADKLAELRAAGDQREVAFAVNVVITGVVQHGEEPADPASAPSAPSFASREDAAIRPPLPAPVSTASDDAVDLPDPNEEEEPQPPVIESYVCVQTRRCHDGEDPGEIAEGWFSVDGKVLTVTDAKGKYVGSRTMLKGEDARVVAKLLLREKKQPSDFNRPLSYPNAGLA